MKQLYPKLSAYMPLFTTPVNIFCWIMLFLQRHAETVLEWSKYKFTNLCEIHEQIMLICFCGDINYICMQCVYCYSVQLSFKNADALSSISSFFVMNLCSIDVDFSFFHGEKYTDEISVMIKQRKTQLNFSSINFSQSSCNGNRKSVTP